MAAESLYSLNNLQLIPQYERKTMINNSQNSNDILQSGLARSAAMMTTQTEQAILMAKANFEQIADKSREAMEQSVQTVNFLTIMTRGHVEALLETARVASGSMQNIAHGVADYSKNTLERAANAARILSQAKSTSELIHLQGEFARNECTIAIAEVTKLSETMFKTMTAIFDPLQKQAVAAANKLASESEAD